MGVTLILKTNKRKEFVVSLTIQTIQRTPKGFKRFSTNSWKEGHFLSTYHIFARHINYTQTLPLCTQLIKPNRIRWEWSDASILMPVITNGHGLGLERTTTDNMFIQH